MDDEAPKKDDGGGAPAWIMTFADLMSLLMCFFVLLLSFSEMDVEKYKQIAGSMKDAFGVQRQIKVKEPPKGINIVAREFSAGKPEPTLLNVVRQNTTNDLQKNLELGDSKRKGKGEGKGGRKTRLAMAQSPDAMAMLKAREEAERKRRLKRAAQRIRTALRAEIKDGSVDVETEQNKIVIRIREKASFPSGTADLRPDFVPLLARVGRILKKTKGRIVVAGHTDNLPINTLRYRSNWDLSAARAVSVVHVLTEEAGLDRKRFLVEGYADTRPVVPNDSPAHRARNRRVEIILATDDNAKMGGGHTYEGRLGKPQDAVAIGSGRKVLRGVRH